MKIYISGDTPQVLTEEVKNKFELAEIYLKMIGHSPVNPLQVCKDGQLSPWPKRLEFLSECEAIFFLADWLNSQECVMEKYYCDVTGKEVMFQSRSKRDEDAKLCVEEVTSRIKGAIEEVSGRKLSDYASGPRKWDDVFLRMIFSHQCFKAGMTPPMIACFIARDRTSIIRYVKLYDVECQTNPDFRSLARRVDDKLYPKASYCNTFKEHVEAY